jgi:ferredoxin-type protein NapH
VLNLKKLDERGYVFSGECSNCGRCTPLCPEGSLKFDFKPLIRSHVQADATAVQRRTT